MWELTKFFIFYSAIVRNVIWVLASTCIISLVNIEMSEEHKKWCFVIQLTCELYIGFSFYAAMKMYDGLYKVRRLYEVLVKSSRFVILAEEWPSPEAVSD